jgi:DNA polymerase-3 subunit delta
MTPEQLLKTLEKKSPDPVYLFLGPEAWRRRSCRQAIVNKLLSPEEIENGFVRHDLDEVSLAEVIDDAKAMSLFAPTRVIWVSSAESAVPKGRAAESDDESEGKQTAGGEALLKEYCSDPAPGVVLVFDARKFDFDGEDKTKIERVRKFYASISSVVEFQRMTDAEAKAFAQTRASELGVQLGRESLELLVEATGGDPERIANEMDKLALFAASGDGKVTPERIAALVPNASEATIFELVNSLARRDRAVSLDLLDRLVREGEYLPLALTFLSGIFRLAVVAREQGLRSSMDVQNYFQRQGVPMWRARAEQIYTTSSRFSKERLEEAIQLVFRADRAMKSSRPDDRIVMEDFVLKLTR